MSKLLNFNILLLLSSVTLHAMEDDAHNGDEIRHDVARIIFSDADYNKPTPTLSLFKYVDVKGKGTDKENAKIEEILSRLAILTDQKKVSIKELYAYARQGHAADIITDEDFRLLFKPTALDSSDFSSLIIAMPSEQKNHTTTVTTLSFQGLKHLPTLDFLPAQSLNSFARDAKLLAAGNMAADVFFDRYPSPPKATNAEDGEDLSLYFDSISGISTGNLDTEIFLTMFDSAQRYGARACEQDEEDEQISPRCTRSLSERAGEDHERQLRQLSPGEKGEKEDERSSPDDRISEDGNQRSKKRARLLPPSTYVEDFPDSVWRPSLQENVVAPSPPISQIWSSIDFPEGFLPSLEPENPSKERR